MGKDDQPDIIIKTFDSPGEFLQWATNAPSPWKGKLESREVSEDRTEWTGTKDYKEAYGLALYGWEEGLKKLSDQVALAEQIPPMVAPPRKRYDVAGYYPNPGRAAAGEMFSMVAPGKEFKQKPVVRIRLNSSYSSYISPDKVIEWGAAVVSYVNAIERTGRSVQLDWIAENLPSEGARGPKLSFQFPLKKAGEPLSLSAVAFWWAHPSAYRRIEFAAKERLDIQNWFSSGYGTPGKVTQPEPYTLSLSIDDAGQNLQQSLENIRKKHLTVLETDDSLREQLGQPLRTAQDFAPS